MGVFRDQTKRITRWEKACADCKAQCDAGQRTDEEIHDPIGECTDCGLPSCEHHGKEYNSGFQHESCHEATDYSRIED